jgi:hypothetical protein
MFPNIPPLIQYNTTSAEQVFCTCHYTIFKLFSKSFCRSISNFFIICGTIAFGMFLESSEQHEVRQYQYQAVGRALNNLKSDAIATGGNTHSVASGNCNLFVVSARTFLQARPAVSH